MSAQEDFLPSKRGEVYKWKQALLDVAFKIDKECKDLWDKFTDRKSLILYNLTSSILMLIRKRYRS